MFRRTGGHRGPPLQLFLKCLLTIKLRDAYYFRDNQMLLQAAAATTTTQTVGSPITAYWPVMVFFVVAVIFPVLPIVLGRFLRPIKYEKNKMQIGRASCRERV